jgi:hypothetical protein
MGGGGIPKRRRQQVGFVENQHVGLVRSGFFHVFLQVFAAIEQRVPRVNDLDDNITALNNAPQLPPNFNVAFEGRQSYLLRSHVMSAAKTAQRTEAAPGFVLLQLQQSPSSRPSKRLSHWRRFRRATCRGSMTVASARASQGLDNVREFNAGFEFLFEGQHA